MNEREHLLVCTGEEAVEIAREAVDLPGGEGGELARAGLGVAKVAAKALRFGPQDRNVLDPTGPTNAERLAAELNDLLALAALLVEAGVLPVDWHDPRAQAAKRAKVGRFMDYARVQGALDDASPSVPRS